LKHIAIGEVAAQLRALGERQGGVLLVHSSFRAVRPVENGPLSLIEALRAALGPGGTLVMPAWTGNDDEPIDPEATPAAADLGVVPETFRRLPGVVRSNHPIAFAASGPAAAWINADPLPLPPHIAESPVGRVHECDGQLLLLGVGHEADTTLHLAEVLARVPYTYHREAVPRRKSPTDRLRRERPFAAGASRSPMHGCGSEASRPRGRSGMPSPALFRARDLVAAAFEHLSRDLLLFLHPRGTGCIDCDEAWSTVPGPPPRPSRA